MSFGTAALAALAALAVPMAPTPQSVPGNEVRAVHMASFGQLPSRMLEGFGLAFLKDLLERFEVLDDDARWDEARLSAALHARTARYAAGVDRAIFASIALRLSPADLATLSAAIAEARKAAGVRCVMTTAKGPKNIPWDSCAAEKKMVFDAPLKQSINRYSDALNAAITERPANAGLGAAVCETADAIERSFDKGALQFEFTRLTFGLGSEPRTCPELIAEARRLWPTAGAAQ